MSMKDINKVKNEPLEKSPASIISSTRYELHMTMREFGAALEVSHNMIAVYEGGANTPTDERLMAWLNDPREWVWKMALDIYLIKNTPLIAAAQARQAEMSMAG